MQHELRKPLRPNNGLAEEEYREGSVRVQIGTLCIDLCYCALLIAHFGLSGDKRSRVLESIFLNHGSAELDSITEIGLEQQKENGR